MITIPKPKKRDDMLFTVVTGKGGDQYFLNDEVVAYALNDIKAKQYFNRRVKQMSNEIKDAIEKTETITQEFEAANHKLVTAQNKITTTVKTTSSQVRDASEKLSQGMARIEKAANFDRLERYAVLLERAAKAMNELAELEQSGRLEKIANAIK